MAESASPEPRSHHESAIIGDELHLFGGRKGKPPYYYFPRNEIWTCNVQKEKKWIRRHAQGKSIPPPCEGAQCVVINGIMYSYGGLTEVGGYLGEVFGLDSKKMKWIQAATPIRGKKPRQRRSCCLWAIGGRMIMFGGFTNVARDCLQSGAQCNGAVNNEIYEFVFEKGREKGYWLDVELSGKRPQPRQNAATETIDQHRGLLHGGDDWFNSLDDAFVIDLREKKWICIDFLPKPSARQNHRMFRLSKQRFKERNCFLLIGGYNFSIFLNQAYILDFDKRKSYAFHLNREVASIDCHTLHCVENQGGSLRIIVTGGLDQERELKEILNEFTLGPSNESYMQIETQILSPNNESRITREYERELEEMRMDMAKLRDGRTHSHQVIEEQRRQFEEERMQKTIIEAQYQSSEEERTRLVEQRTQLQARNQSLEEEKMRLIEQRSGLLTRCNSLQRDNDVLRTRCRDLEREKEDVAHAFEAQTRSLTEAQKNIDQFMNVLSISASQVRLTNEKLGSGAYADVIIGHWHGMPVAVKRFHALITTRRTIPTFRREVLTASRLHHPNIIRVCGAVMEDGIAFQIVSELLEGSVSEVIDAAHSSPCYLSHYEQLCIVVQMTSAIAYLHELHPRPYVHADIRPTNVLVTRDMKVKVADLGAAHLVESSKSAGPLSPQYLAPERMPPTSARSSLPSDVYSLGVSLIEIFTGVDAIPEERNRQLSQISNRHLHRICFRMISDEEKMRERPTSAECLVVLIRQMEEIMENGYSAMKRLVKGEFEGEGDDRRHKVVLSDTYHP
ncbi:uncharacterized protein [Oscarella lobularis]|uniref:uncharacterized protein n=1 Tax=Oscarella lobularis TaxID=121494 RepID=UPI00331442ED